MQVRILLFGVLKDIFQRSEELLELASGSTVSELLDHYRQIAPEKGEFFHSLALAVNQQYASPNHELQDGDEVALLPPVSGGTEATLSRSSYQCEIVRHRIPTERALESIKQREDGAVVVFEGKDEVDEADEWLVRRGATGNTGGVVWEPQKIPPTFSHEVSATFRK